MMRSLTPVFSILIGILLYFFFIAPGIDEINEIRAEREVYVEAIAQYDAFNQKLNTLLTLKRSQSQTTIERLNQLVPSKSEPARLIADLEQMARENNMLFGNISTELEEQKSSNRSVVAVDESEQDSLELNTTDISFDVIGTYEQLKGFIEKMERSLTLYEVVGLTFSDGGTGIFNQYSFTVRTYSLASINQ